MMWGHLSKVNISAVEELGWQGHRGQLPPCPLLWRSPCTALCLRKKNCSHLAPLHFSFCSCSCSVQVKLVKPYKIKINCEWEVLRDDVNKSFWRQHNNHSGYADQSFNDTKANQYYIYFLYAYAHCDTNICEPKSNNDHATNSGAWVRYIRK